MDAFRTYTIILEPAEEGGFVVHVPALPEVVTEGDTEQEALVMAREAIELVLASRRERGEPLPEETNEPIIRKLTIGVAADANIFEIVDGAPHLTAALRTPGSGPLGAAKFSFSGSVDRLLAGDFARKFESP